MMRTLHYYFLRELLKTFALTAIGLTLLVTMGGGIRNIFRGQGLDAARVVKIFIFFVPVAVTLVLPIAALFSATITYGRASADNEVNACRAAGINVHRLLLAPIVLSLFITVFTYSSWNYFIPSLTERVYRYTRQDLPAMILSGLRRNAGFNMRDYVLYADDAFELSRDQLPADTPSDRSYIVLQRAVFTRMEGVQPSQIGSTERAIIEFDNSGRVPEVRIDLQDVQSFDITRSQYTAIDHQLMGPYEVPLPIARKLRFENLPTLKRYAEAPEEIPEMTDVLRKFRTKLGQLFVYESCTRALDPSLGGRGAWTLEDRSGSIELRARELAVDDDGKPHFRGVTVVEMSSAGRRVITAGEGGLSIQDSVSPERPSVIVVLTGGVESRFDPARADDRPIKKTDERLRPIQVPSEVRERLLGLKLRDLGDPNQRFPLPPRYAKEREKLLTARDRLVCEVASVIHFRSSYAVSTIAVVALGAILGVVLRGGQVLTAFGISCIPSLVVVIGEILGRNLAEHPPMHEWGLRVMWVSNGLLAAATVFIGARFMKR